MHYVSSNVFICAGLVRKLRRALNEASARAHMFVDQCVKFEKDNIDQVGVGRPAVHPLHTVQLKAWSSGS